MLGQITIVRNHLRRSIITIPNDTLNSSKIENTSPSQQTDIIKTITGTNKQTITYADNN